MEKAIRMWKSPSGNRLEKTTGTPQEVSSRTTPGISHLQWSSSRADQNRPSKSPCILVNKSTRSLFKIHSWQNTHIWCNNWWNIDLEFLWIQRKWTIPRVGRQTWQNCFMQHQYRYCKMHWYFSKDWEIFPLRWKLSGRTLVLLDKYRKWKSLY